MKYERHNFTKGQTLTHKHLNHMEDGIVAAMSPYAGEKWAFLGDSITEGINTTKTYHAFLAERLGITAVNVGKNGSCISTYILTTDAQHAVCMCNRISTVPKDIDRLFIFGGTNDFNRGCPLGEAYTTDENGKRTFSTDKNTFKGALSVLYSYVKNNFDGCKVYILTPIHRGRFQSQPTDMEKSPGASGLYLEDYVNAIKEVASLYSVGQIIDTYTECGLNPNFAPCAKRCFHDGSDGLNDLLHPNANGHEELANYIMKELGIPAWKIIDINTENNDDNGSNEESSVIETIFNGDWTIGKTPNTEGLNVTDTRYVCMTNPINLGNEVITIINPKRGTYQLNLSICDANGVHINFQGQLDNDVWTLTGYCRMCLKFADGRSVTQEDWETMKADIIAAN